MTRRTAAIRGAAIGGVCALLLLVAPAAALAQEAGGGGGLGDVGVGVGVGDGWDWLALGLKLVLVLAAIWLVILGMRWYVRRAGGGAGSAGRHSRLEVIETRSLGGHRSLQLVHMGDRVVLLGVTQERITPLLEIADAEELEQLLAPADGVSERARSFGGFLSGMSSSLARAAERRRAGDGVPTPAAPVADGTLARRRAASAAYSGMRVVDLQRALETTDEAAS